MLKRVWVLSGFFLLATVAVANQDNQLSYPQTTQKIYKNIGPDGKVTFSDKPSQGAETIDVEPLQTFKAKTPAVSSGSTVTPPTLSGVAQSDPAFQYEAINIVKPRDQETVWSNPGSLTVDVAIQPKLRRGDKVVLILDGKVVKTSTGSTRFKLTRVERGEHTLSAKVLDQSGNELLVSPSSTVILHKASTNMPARN